MSCNLCPRKCNIDRKTDTGWCKTGESLKIAKVMLHKWEEPCICTGQGSGAIFFSGCNLKCVYCQNRDISHEGYGKEYTPTELANEMLRLQDMGACNVNLVTPTHFSDKIRQALDIARPRLKIPVVYNTSGYELDTEIYKMADYVDVFLTDFKYFSPDLAQKYSKAKDYFSVAKDGLEAMLKLQPKCVFDPDENMVKGVIVRHLVLPGCRRDSMEILDFLAREFDVSTFKLSLMAQYTPEFCQGDFPELKRKITTFEYQSVVDRAVSLGFDGYIQDKDASSVQYTPKFKEEEL